jgi:hypothetical protein
MKKRFVVIKKSTKRLSILSFNTNHFPGFYYFITIQDIFNISKNHPRKNEYIFHPIKTN